MNRLIAALAMTTVLAAPALAQKRPIGAETSIAFAGNGGLRNWQNDAHDPKAVYVQDRQLQWYRVALTGPCLSQYPSSTLLYRTDSDGIFDRFSNVWSSQAPGAVCGVESIRTSAPPVGQPGAPRDAK